MKSKDGHIFDAGDIDIATGRRYIHWNNAKSEILYNFWCIDKQLSFESKEGEKWN